MPKDVARVIAGITQQVFEGLDLAGRSPCEFSSSGRKPASDLIVVIGEKPVDIRYGIAVLLERGGLDPHMTQHTT